MGGLPLDDPLRFDANDELLSKEALGELLDGIIQSWPMWDWNVITSPPEQRVSLSGEREAPRRRQWLSR
jgi:hypothetical protein